jgi:hypothetical protein
MTELEIGMLSQMRDWLPFLAELAFWPKVLVTLIVLALAAFVLTAIWAPRQVRKADIDITAEKPKQETALQFASIDPYEIRDKIDSLPPFQQNKAKENYLGIGVKWKGKFSHITEQASGSIRVSLQAVPRVAVPGIARPVWVDFSVRLSDYPQLKIIEKDTGLSVIGRIVGFDQVGAIMLDYVKISFPWDQNKTDD